MRDGLKDCRTCQLKEGGRPGVYCETHYLQEELAAPSAADFQILDFFFRTAADGVWLLDVDRPEHQWMSPRFWQRLGYPPATKPHLAAEWDRVLHAEDRSIARALIDRQRAEPDFAFDEIFRLRHRDGSTVWMRCRTVTIRLSSGSIRILGTLADVTNLKASEAQARQLAEDLEAKAKQLEEQAQSLLRANDRLSAFTYAVSHDLKAPLRGIAICAGWLEEELAGGLSPSAAENLEFIKQRTQRLTSMINGALEFAQAGQHAAPPDRVDTEAMVNELVYEFHLREGVELFEVESPLPVVSFNGSELARVFQNLLSNAVRFAAGEGRVTSIRAVDLGPVIRFEVSDQGPGIAPRHHDRVFELFNTLQPRDDVESSGVGLSICRTIVERWGGQIGVDSDGKNGSTFWFTVPKQEEIVGPPRPESVEAPPHPT